MGENKKNTLRTSGKLWVFVLIGLLGLGLLIFGAMSSSKKTAAEKNVEESALDPESYARTVEERVESICRGATGGYSAEAVVSLEGGYRAVYATDSQSTGNGYKNSMVTVGNGSSEEVVLVCYENPRISGIGIVLSCRENDKVRRDVISLVSAAFSVSTNKIYVAFSS